ncbi:MAG: hypothetical protein OJF48_003431 [Afipia sp.]|jgi:hypothetical protein|nr:MAG: hypothetical protein OJF48_003431 [Afipia sp.]
MLMLACTLSALPSAKALAIINIVVFGVALAIAIGVVMLHRWNMIRRARRSVPHLALNHASLECTCPARSGACACANMDGVRNPRGAGRGRMSRP